MSRDLLAPIDALLTRCLVRDRHALLRRRRELAERIKAGKPADRLAAQLLAAAQASADKVAARRERLPVPAFDEALPVNQKRYELLAAIDANQVVIVCGETGSGKTTQLPKLCLQLGRGTRGLIGHTQPRRLAARSVASRIAEELGTQIGQGVGFKVRFTDRTSDQSFIKLMTDGILLAETQTDRYLEAYVTLIIDESH